MSRVGASGGGANPGGTTPDAGRGRRGGRAHAPWPLLVLGGLAFAFLVLPLLAIVARAPWGRLLSVLGDGPVLQALVLSMRTASLATLVGLVVGVPLAWLLARGGLRGTGVVRALVTLPMVLPPVVGGVALLSLLGRRGIVGQWLHQWFGLSIPFTTAAVVLAQAFVALPFLVLSVDGALRGLDRGQEDVARTLGASEWTVFRRITLPRLAPAIGAGAVLCFARALGEFGATITFAGNFPGTTRTMPIAIYLAMQQDPAAALTMSVLLMTICAVVLVLLRSHWLTALGRTG